MLNKFILNWKDYELLTTELYWRAKLLYKPSYLWTAYNSPVVGAVDISLRLQEAGCIRAPKTLLKKAC